MAKKIAPKKLKGLVNHFLIALDSSGSMDSVAEDAVRAFNDNVEAIRSSSAKEKQKSTVSLVTFGEGSAVRVKFFAKDVKTLKPLRQSDFNPDGMTPMLDGVGTGIERLETLKDDKKTSYIVICISDGAENHSKKYTKGNGKLTKLMKEKSDTDRWSFVFLVPPGDGAKIASQLKLPAGNVQEWSADSAGAKKAGAAVSKGISSFLQNRSAGKSSTQGFFTVNLDKARVSDIKRNLNNIAADVFAWNVPAEVDIRSFVEDKGETFIKGNGYYQLTKPETVQSYKEIMIKEKSGRAIYGGPDARAALGFPEGANFKFKPGNMGQYDLFIQSTSVNRKLVRGTTLLYKR